MNADQTFWFSIFKLLVILMCCLTISITGSCQYSKHTIGKMVDKGRSPIEAACSLEIINDNYRTKAECITFTNNRVAHER